MSGHFIYANPANDFEVTPPFNAKGAELIVDVTSGSGSIYVRARAYNECGASDWKYFSISSNPVNYYLVSPNPASETITIQEAQTTSSENSTGEQRTSITEIKIFNDTGILKKQSKYSAGAKQVQLNVSDLRPGLHFIEISNGKIKVKQRLLIQR